jgi:hypothetical protein
MTCNVRQVRTASSSPLPCTASGQNNRQSCASAIEGRSSLKRYCVSSDIHITEVIKHVCSPAALSKVVGLTESQAVSQS